MFPARIGRYSGDGSSWPIQPTTRNELSTYPSETSLPLSTTGQKARSDKIARDALFPELGRLYFTRRKFLVSQTRECLGETWCSHVHRNDYHGHSSSRRKERRWTLLRMDNGVAV